MPETAPMRSKIELSPLEILDRAGSRCARPCRRASLRRHPRGLTAAVVVALAGFAATAFGIAPMVPDPADLPQRLVSETVLPTGLDAQLELLAEHELSLYRSDLTRRSDTADSLLRRLNADDAEARAVPAPRPHRAQAARRPPRQDGAGAHRRRKAGSRNWSPAIRPRPASSAAPTSRACSSAAPVDALQARTETVPLESQVRLGSGTINSSLFAATDDARIPDAIATQMVEMFSAEIDFHRELRKGDSFTVIYETLTADGEPITWASGSEMTGRVLAAEFVNNGRTPLGAVVRRHGGRRQGRLLRARRPEQAARLPRQPAGVLARHVELRDALPSDPADHARAPGRRLRRADRHAGAQRRRGCGRDGRLAERLRQHGADQAQQRSHHRSMPT